MMVINKAVRKKQNEEGTIKEWTWNMESSNAEKYSGDAYFHILIVTKVKRKHWEFPFQNQNCLFMSRVTSGMITAERNDDTVGIL